MNEYAYPAINAERKNGTEQLIGVPLTTISEFWQWAYSNVMDNAERGIFAEWLVAKALEAADGTRVEWDKYDILTPTGIRVEVKTSGYIQSWGQKELSKVSFGIQQTMGWNSQTNMYEQDKKRQSDVYVFCVHKHKEQKTVNPLDIRQWDFYVINTNVLNSKVGNQKSLTLSKLIEIGAVLTDYSYLKTVVETVFLQ